VNSKRDRKTKVAFFFCKRTKVLLITTYLSHERSNRSEPTTEHTQRHRERERTAYLSHVEGLFSFFFFFFLGGKVNRVRVLVVMKGCCEGFSCNGPYVVRAVG
jgi:hypothetical protein